jgi:hypothetical protein
MLARKPSSSWARLRLLYPAILFTVGCGDDPTGPIDENLLELAGAWRATKFEYVSHDDSSERVNLASLGTMVTLTIAEDGVWTLLVTRPGLLSYQVSSGSLTVEDGSIILQWNGYDEPMTFGFELLDDTLTMETADAQYDFDTDGTRDPADLAMILLRL